ncbi:unnamed protein product [Hymenolepis diminuta]|uniref:Uncharacterized protein n=1 Tax=Hymenolepis diminuta TaxID=6216 RepID=A0A564Y7U7_HYMDI|nr:unnamed protein product [Hymenolepis diminuta]
MLICHPKQIAPMNNKCKQPEEIGLTKPVSLAYATMPKVVAHYTRSLHMHYYQDLNCSQNNVHESHIDPSFAEPIQRVSYPRGFSFKVA